MAENNTKTFNEELEKDPKYIELSEKARRAQERKKQYKSNFNKQKRKKKERALISIGKNIEKLAGGFPDDATVIRCYQYGMMVDKLLNYKEDFTSADFKFIEFGLRKYEKMRTENPEIYKKKLEEFEACLQHTEEKQESEVEKTKD